MFYVLLSISFGMVFLLYKRVIKLWNFNILKKFNDVRDKKFCLRKFLFVVCEI